ncbi:phage protein, HK97 gp10 family [Onishia taeanensis]|uniref:Phage protein, HK97 gp10 family n=1 Tax=Onishia taeanensis TaxID=284577 RepID=A0A1G7N6Y3_9GAMM|nr:HK97-gp10 family putative phage morphogenesis protein [Halomonas taeanensis]SDF69793.1 phage protein, HK97 gp10 family [Halomonas taeanensis]
MATDGLAGDIQGLEEVLGKLNALEQEPRKKSTRFALRKAANIVRDSVQSRARELDDPNTSESIADNVVVRFDGKHFRQTGDLKMRVGIRGGGCLQGQERQEPGR